MSTPSPSVASENVLQRTVSRLFGSPWFWVFFVSIGFGWPLVRVVRTVLPPPLPVLGAVSDFTVVDQNEKPFGTEDLRGRVWLVAELRTRAPLADKLATELGKVQHRVRNLGPAFHVVTLSGDSEVDTPEHLRDFAGHHRVSPRIWSLLSGTPDLASKVEQATGGGPLSVALVDREMRVRGRYDLGDPNAIDVLLWHAGLLVNRGN